MPLDRITEVLDRHVQALEDAGTSKGVEAVVVKVLPPTAERGPRFLLEGQGGREFLRMNSNSYLGMGLRPEVIEAEEEGTREFGAGPGAVRFISGTYAPHVELERRLAAFHGREAGMVFSSAYATVMGVLPALITDKTAVISDALNHNSIINAISLARPAEKRIYAHVDYDALDRQLGELATTCSRAVVITDGVFSMRGDHADLARIMQIAAKHDASYAENVIVVADDSHGVGAFGNTGRGTEEVVGGSVDVLIGTLGKAFGVMGGYIAADRTIVDVIRSYAPGFIFTTSLSPVLVAGALASVRHLKQSCDERDAQQAVAARLKTMFAEAGLPVMASTTHIVPLMVGDPVKAKRISDILLAEYGVYVQPINFPTVPRGTERLRFTPGPSHTDAMMRELTAALVEIWERLDMELKQAA